MDSKYPPNDEVLTMSQTWLDLMKVMSDSTLQSEITYCISVLSHYASQDIETPHIKWFKRRLAAAEQEAERRFLTR